MSVCVCVISHPPPGIFVLTTQRSKVVGCLVGCSVSVYVAPGQTMLLRRYCDIQLVHRTHVDEAVI